MVFFGAISLLPFFHRKAIEMGNGKAEHLEAYKKVLSLFGVLIHLIIVVVVTTYDIGSVSEESECYPLPECHEDDAVFVLVKSAYL
jgi:hypothetical protein